MSALIKWRLMLTTMPFVAAAVSMRLVLARVADFHGVVDFAEVGLVLTGGVFLIGVMLAGTMADFKESEKLPAEVACTLETIEEGLRLAAVTRPVLDEVALCRVVLQVSDAISDWLLRKIDHHQVFLRVESLNETAHALERAGATVLASRTINEISNLRKAVMRMDVISRTSFLSSGYALLESVVVAAVLLVLIARFRSPIAEYTLVAFVTLVFVYMVRLIKDVDDPFEYSIDGARGAAEVEVFPLLEHRERAARRLTAAETRPAE